MKKEKKKSLEGKLVSGLVVALVVTAMFGIVLVASAEGVGVSSAVMDTTISSSQIEEMDINATIGYNSRAIDSNSGEGDWKYQKAITIKENSGETLTDYQVLVELKGDNFPSKAKTDGADIRFTSAEGKELSYWIESWDYYSKSAKIWVKVPIIPAKGETKIMMLHGNPSASSQSNGDATFLFFDDFDDGTWTDKWLQSRADASYDYATITESNGKVTFTNCCQWNFYCSQGPGILISKSNFTISNEGFVLDVDHSIASDNAGYSQVATYIVGNAMYGDPVGTWDRHYGIVPNTYSTDKTRALYPPDFHQTDDHLLTYTLGVPYRHIVNYSGSALLNITVYDKNGQVAGSHDYSLSYSDSATLRVMLYVQSAGSYYRDVKLRKYASELPDLSLSPEDISFSNPSPAVGETITINATIHNIGDADASDVTVQSFDGEPTTGTQIGANQTVDSLTAGGSETVSVEWTAEAGTHDIYVVVDLGDQIEESNEDNNIAFKTISTVIPEIANLMALEEEFYNKALETIDLQGDNLARITADCIIDIFSSIAAGEIVEHISVDEDFISQIADIFPALSAEETEYIISEASKEAIGKPIGEASGILQGPIRSEIVEPMIESEKDNITLLHQEFLTYMSTHAGEFSADRINECEEGLKVGIDALEEAQRFETGSWNPFERLPFVYLGSRHYQINAVSMAVCGYDWADSSYLAEFNNIAYKIPGWNVGALITGFGIKPGVVLAAYFAIDTDAWNIYGGYGYTVSAIKEGWALHTNLIDDSCTTPSSLISSILSCPANLHAYDSQGRHVGLNETGGIEIEIPNASYYHNSTTNTTEIVIFDSNDTISFEIKALDIGEFNLTNVQGTNETHTTIAYHNISMETENTTATVDFNATSTNYTLDLDSDGDDIVDDVLSPNSTEVNYFPNASIVYPKNGMSITKGQSIAFEGSGTDAEDGELSGSSLIWISSIDGMIGTGCSFRMSNLSVGNHTVSLTAIDSGGLADVSRVSITVFPNCWCDTFDNTDKIASSTNITVSGGDVKLNNATKGNLTSIRITPFSLQIWDKFYANDTLPEGTNITYKMLNASDNSTFCTINSTQANAGYCISECASGVDSIRLIRLYTELTTTNASYTPVLHDWNVSWIPEVTPMLTITHAKTDKKTYNLNESVRISCVVQNETGQNISADVVFVNITNPDGYFEQMSMDEGLVGHYSGTFTNTSLIGVYNVTVYANKTGYVNDTAELSFVVVSGPAVFDTGPGGYPSIRGTHNGTITPSHDITVTKMYTYPCFKTGGHSEFVTFFNSSTGDEIANGTWIGTYLWNYQWIEFSEPFTLKVGVTYNYTIITGSYPQIHHTDALQTANGWINCTKFTDANGKIYYDWIPTIRLCS